MNRQLADGLVGLLLTGVLVVGFYNAWTAYQRNQADDGMMGGGMMDGTMGVAPGVDPYWYMVGAIIAAAVVGGVYAIVRDDLVDTHPSGAPASTVHSNPTDTTALGGSTAVGTGESPPDDTPSTTVDDPSRLSEQRVLDLLPDDERRILEPVITSPGLTQIALRDRSDFSKSKVSQTVSALEKRGLLYRERQGRTYRVYPDESVIEGPSK